MRHVPPHHHHPAPNSCHPKRVENYITRFFSHHHYCVLQIFSLLKKNHNTLFLSAQSVAFWTLSKRWNEVGATLCQNEMLVSSSVWGVVLQGGHSTTSESVVLFWMYCPHGHGAELNGENKVAISSTSVLVKTIWEKNRSRKQAALRCWGNNRHRCESVQGGAHTEHSSINSGCPGSLPKGDHNGAEY